MEAGKKQGLRFWVFRGLFEAALIVLSVVLGMMLSVWRRISASAPA